MSRTTFSTSTALALVAVVLASSTTVFAVARIPKHSVGAKQLKTSAVTNKKIARYAVTSSKVKPNALSGSQINEAALGRVPSAANATTAGNAARLEGLGAAAFVGAPRMAFGKGNATDVPATTVLKLANLGVTVTTDGESDVSPEVIVTLPSTLPASSWIVAAEGSPMFSTNGTGPVPLSPPGTTNGLTVHIWRFDTNAGLYLHCAFDTTGFTTSRPLSCWAFST